MRRMYSKNQLKEVVDKVLAEEDLQPISGTNDGTNWTSLTVGSDTYAIPQGGSGSGMEIISLSGTSGTLSASDLAKVIANPAGCVFKVQPLADIPAQYNYCFLAVYLNYGSPDIYVYRAAANLTGSASMSQGVLTIDTSTGAWDWRFDTRNNVSGTSDGTNWTSLTIGGQTHGFASGGGGGSDIEYVNSSTTGEQLAAIIAANKMPVYVYSTSNGKSFLPCISAAGGVYKFAAVDSENLWYITYNESWSSLGYYPLSNWAELGWVTLNSTSAQVWDCVQNYTLPVLHTNSNRDLYFYVYRSAANASGSFVFTRVKDNICETYTLLNDTWTYSSYSLLPTAPTTDGNYTLKCTVNNDTVTYTWVAI